MRRIGITQRVMLVHQERRDALDQRWHGLLRQCDLRAVPLPNDAALALDLARDLALAGFIFSGGNDLHHLGGDAPERDATEQALLDLGLPVLGVCRGMQFLAHSAGGTVAEVGGHAGTRHEVIQGATRRDVNSYHRFAVLRAGAGQVPWAFSNEGHVEAFMDQDRRCAGIMWHPEREPRPHDDDLALMRRLFLA